MVVIQEITRWHFYNSKTFPKEKHYYKGKKKNVTFLLHHLFVRFLNSDGCLK